MLQKETFALAMALINGVLYDKHKILENSELDVYYEILKNEIQDEILFIESVKDLIKKWPNSYKRPSPSEIILSYKEYKKEKENEILIERQIEATKKLNSFLIEKKANQK